MAACTITSAALYFIVLYIVNSLETFTPLCNYLIVASIYLIDLLESESINNHYEIRKKYKKV